MKSPPGDGPSVSEVDREESVKKRRNPLDGILTALRDDVNLAFGVSEEGPRINQGPCGPFALMFFEAWKRRFVPGCQICFLVGTRNPTRCYHCFIHLPDGRFFDGGFGVMSRRDVEDFAAREIGAGMATVEIMEEFDADLFDRRSYGRMSAGRPLAPRCPLYTNERATELIERRLAELARACPGKGWFERGGGRRRSAVRYAAFREGSDFKPVEALQPSVR